MNKKIFTLNFYYIICCYECFPYGLPQLSTPHSDESAMKNRFSKLFRKDIEYMVTIN